MTAKASKKKPKSTILTLVIENDIRQFSFYQQNPKNFPTLKATPLGKKIKKD